jgi:acyl transferase domain-containing protein/NADPH:quinone reductase-like Zn-dependent oxidoreductase/surfactin synthase thioesterase subunit/acyl carrier protein
MCSSSMVALHLGVQSLKTGECDMAIAAGANLNFEFQDFIRMSIIGAAAKDGRSKAFSANADGYAKGEGIGVVILKRLDKALIDGDRIHAIVRGSSVNHDGKRKNGITITSAIGQKDLFERVYKEADIDPSTVDYVESHTTGTLVGDPIEASALGEFFGKARREAGLEGPVKIGSVKSNIGHTEAMSGIASLAKVVMMFKHKTIPPTVVFDRLNPKINFEDLNLKVITKAEPLPKKALVGLSSFGMGGTNGHIIVESYEQNKPLADEQASYLLLLSARRSDKVLVELAKNMKEFVNAELNKGVKPAQLFADMCYTAAIRRSHHDNRLAISFKNLEDFNAKIDAFVNSERKLGVLSGVIPETEVVKGKQKMVFVFSGQGPQWFAMGRHLIASEPVFRACMQRIDKELSKYVDWSLVEELIQKDDATSRINQTDFAQPGIFAIQVALYELLKSLSIVPDIVIGHSVGEVAAAYVAGALTFEDAVLVIYERSRLQHKCSFINKGKMLAVNISEADARNVITGLEDKLSIAAINSATSVTISGDEEALKHVVEIINSNSRLAKASKVYLRTSAAFHSVHMDPIKDELLQSLATIKPQRTKIPLFSTVTGDKISGCEVDGEYWWRNVRQAVLFEQGVKSIMERYNSSSPLKYWIELAPHPVLSSFIKGIINQYQPDAQVFPTLIRKEDENILMKNILGNLYIHGYRQISWNKIFEGNNGSLISLPAYPFQKTRYWMETTESQEDRLSPPHKYHPLLGSRKIPTQGPQPVWRNHISLSNVKQEFLKDHVVQGSIIYPFAGFIENTVAAICEYHEVNAVAGNLTTVISLKNFNVGTAMVLKHDEVRVVETILSPNSKTFQIVSRVKPTDNDLLTTMDRKLDFSNKWVTHAHGEYEIIKKPFSVEEDFSVESEVSKEATYNALYNRGLMYGPAFQGIVSAVAEDDQVWGFISAPEMVRDSVKDYIVHPSLVDSCFQAILTGMVGKETFIPVHLRQMNIFLRPGNFGSINQQVYTSAVFHERVVGNTAANRQMIDMKIMNKDPENGLVSAIIIEDFSMQELASEDEDKNAGIVLVRKWEELQRVKYAELAAPAEVIAQLQSYNPQPSHLFFGETMVKNLKHLTSLFCLNALAGTEKTFNMSNVKIAPEFAVYLNIMVQLIEEEGLAKSTDQVNFTVTTSEKTDLHSIQYLASQYIKEKEELQPFVELVSMVGVAISDLIAGKSTDINAAEILSKLSNTTTDVVISCFEKLVSTLNPKSNIRILQVGSESTELTSRILDLLSAFTEVEYVLTEESEKQLDEAAEKLSKYDKITFTTLNLGNPITYKDAIQPESFDLILSFNASQESLKKLRSLLVPNGTFFLMEWYSHKFMQLIRGLLTGKLMVANDERVQLFNNSGFANVSPFNYCNLTQVIVSSKENKFEPRKWLVFADNTGFANEIVSNLVNNYNQKVQDFFVVTQSSEYTHSGNQFTVALNKVEHYHKLMSDLPTFDKVIYAWALNIPELNESNPVAAFEKQEDTCYSIACTIQALEKIRHIPEFHVVTSGAQVLDSAAQLNIHQSVVVGFMHSAAGDYFGTQSKLIDVDASVNVQENASAVAEELMLHSRNRFNEIHLRGPNRFALHYEKEVPTAPEQKHVVTVVPAETETNFRIAVPKTRLLRDVFFEAVPRPEPREGEVEVKIMASAINFKDILKIRGLHPITVRSNEDAEAKEKAYCDLIGLEAAGVVTRVGPNSQGIKPGDRVVYYSVNDALFKSYSIQQAKLVVKIPDNLTFEQAASIPIVFMTAYYCLFEKAKLKAGQSVLIHCASGGVGLAAIQLCKNAGAKVFATAGTDKKRNFLKEVVGVEHVFSSRNAKFYDEIMKITEGKGIDMIINSISGEMLLKSVDLLATSGSFFELGKRDIFDNRMLNLYKLRNNCAFHIIDLELALLHGDSRDGVIMLEEAMRQHAVGLMKPLQVQSFDIADMKEAFELHQKATSIGKLVLNFNSTKPIQVTHYGPTHPTNLRTGTYLITGGTGGVGLTFAKWLINNKNVKRIVLTSRRMPADDVMNQIKALNTRGVRVEVLTADVADYDQIKRVVDNISSDPAAPLRGIIHSAAVIEDALATNISHELIAKVMRPKIRGAYYLHMLTHHLNLEAFYMTASMSNAVALNGQTHYNAANNFLDCLSAYRRREGKSAMSCSLTAVAGAGFVTRNKTVERLLTAVGVMPVHIDEIVELMEVLNNGAYVTPIISHKNFIADFKGTYLPSPFQRLFSRESQEKGESTEIDGANASSSDSVLTEIHNFVAQVLGTTAENIAVDRSLNQLGFDSLMSVEIRNWMASKFKKNLPLVELSVETVSTLAQKILSASSKKQSGGQASASHDSDSHTDNSHHSSDSHSLNRINALYTTEYPSLRLICFPYMGGSSQDFKDWNKHLPSDIEVYGVDYMLNANDRNSIYDWGVLMELLYDELEPLAADNVPFAFYGHSLGANVAFELTRYLNNKQKQMPAHVFIGAHLSLNTNAMISKMYTQLLNNADDELARKVLEYDLLPGFSVKLGDFDINSKIESVKKLVSMPKLIAEFKLHAHHSHVDDELGDLQVHAPLTVFIGSKDKVTSESDINYWAKQTDKEFEFHVIEGPHLFINEPVGLAAVTQKISSILKKALSQGSKVEFVAEKTPKLRHVSSGEELKRIADLMRELEHEKRMREKLEEKLRKAEEIIKATIQH